MRHPNRTNYKFFDWFVYRYIHFIFTISRFGFGIFSNGILLWMDGLLLRRTKYRSNAFQRFIVHQSINPFIQRSMLNIFIYLLLSFVFTWLTFHSHYYYFLFACFRERNRTKLDFVSEKFRFSCVANMKTSMRLSSFKTMFILICFRALLIAFFRFDFVEILGFTFRGGSVSRRSFCFLLRLRASIVSCRWLAIFPNESNSNVCASHMKIWSAQCSRYWHLFKLVLTRIWSMHSYSIYFFQLDSCFSNNPNCEVN